MSAIAEHRTIPSGHQLHGYKIESILGQGGGGVTYLARDNKSDRLVVVKEYMPTNFACRDEDFTVAPLSSDQSEEFKWGLSRFLSEGKMLARIDHQNIVKVQSVFEKSGTAYIVMEYQDGQNLADLIRHNSASLTQPVLENILFPIMDGLQLVHDAGLIHRDIKPANIHVREDGRPVLTDFSSARQTTSQDTSEMTALASQGYTPLEQYTTSFGEQGPWTDVYALAASAYHGATGSVAEDSLIRSAAVQFGKADPHQPLRTLVGEDFTDRFKSALDRALTLEPRSRPQSLREWRAIFLDEDKTLFAPLSAKEVKTDTLKVADAVSDSDTTSYMPLVGSNSGKVLSPEQSQPAPQLTTTSDSVVNDDQTLIMPLKARVGNPSESDKTATPVTQRKRHSTAEPKVARHGVRKRRKSKASTTAQTRFKRIKKRNFLLAGLAAVLIGVFVSGGAWLPFTHLNKATPPVSVSAVLPTLPDPPQRIVLGSPVVRARTELAELVQVGKAYAKTYEADPQSEQAQLGLEFVADRMGLLGDQQVVQIHPELRQEFSAALSAFEISRPEFANLKTSFENTPRMPVLADVKELLATKTLSSAEKLRLLYGLAFLPNGERQTLSTDSRYSELLGMFKRSVVRELQSGNFQRAAQMLELVMLVQPNDADIVQLSEYMLQ